VIEPFQSDVTAAPAILLAAVIRDLQNRWIRFSHQMNRFGWKVCLARQPRCCGGPLETIRGSSEKTVRQSPTSKDVFEARMGRIKWTHLKPSSETSRPVGWPTRNRQTGE